MKKIFKDWSVFEIILLITGPLIVLLVGIISKSDVLTMNTSIVGIICALLLAKGLVFGKFVYHLI